MAGPRNEGEALAISGLRMAGKYSPGGADEACDRYLGSNGERRYGNAPTSLAREISDNPEGFRDIQGMCQKQFAGAAEPSLMDKAKEYLFGPDTKPGTGPAAHASEKKDPSVSDYATGVKNVVTGNIEPKMEKLGI